jgi:hypothetical protein
MGDRRPSASQSDEKDCQLTWNDVNAVALDERRGWIAANSVTLADLQVLKLD